MGLPIQIAEIQKNEMALGYVFPVAYIQYMSRHNGGAFEVDDDVWELIPLKNTETIKTIKRTAVNILTELQSASAWPHFPKNAIPILQNGSGDYLCFIRQKDRRTTEKVFRWDHETGEISAAYENFSELVPLLETGNT